MKRGKDIKYERELQVLRDENDALKKQLNAKRYLIINAIVDSTYKIMRRGKAVATNVIQKAEATYPVKTVKARKIDKGRVDIVNVNFYNWDGDTLFLGGAERYIFDLAQLLKKMGYRPRILQGANLDFNKKFHGIEVVGVKMEDKAVNAISERFAEIVEDAELVISSPLDIACELDIDRPIIAINHGVVFDHVKTTFENSGGNAYWVYQAALENVSSCVCVDTNFINWLRTKEYRLSEKLCYIPNYFDANVFKPSNKRRGKKARVIYPRRIYNARGADITVKAFEKILAQYADKVELVFIGQYDNDEIREKVERLMKKYPQNVFHEQYNPEEMYKAYEGADIALIPTRHSEGTSLSCIEAMASGVAVIATTVGGLPNLVIDGYNGSLIEPRAEELESAVVDLIEHPTKRKRLAERGLEVAQAAFQKKAWEAKWKEVIEAVL